MEDRTICETIALPAIAGLFTDFNESERVKNRCKGQVRLVIGLKKKNAKKKRRNTAKCALPHEPLPFALDWRNVWERSAIGDH